MSSVFKGIRLIGSVELVFEKRLKLFVMKCKLLVNLKVEYMYNDPRKHATKLRGFNLTSRRNTFGHFVESKFRLG